MIIAKLDSPATRCSPAAAAAASASLSLVRRIGLISPSPFSGHRQQHQHRQKRAASMGRRPPELIDDLRLRDFAQLPSKGVSGVQVRVRVTRPCGRVFCIFSRPRARRRVLAGFGWSTVDVWVWFAHAEHTHRSGVGELTRVSPVFCSPRSRFCLVRHFHAPKPPGERLTSRRPASKQLSRSLSLSQQGFPRPSDPLSRSPEQRG